MPSKARSPHRPARACPLFNLAIAYLLIYRVGSFNLRKSPHVLTLGAGILIMSLMLARTFGRFHGGL
jgi:hypothetical protein